MTAENQQPIPESYAKPQTPPKKFALITNFNISEKANTAMNVADRLLRGALRSWAPPSVAIKSTVCTVSAAS